MAVKFDTNDVVINDLAKLPLAIVLRRRVATDKDHYTTPLNINRNIRNQHENRFFENNLIH